MNLSVRFSDAKSMRHVIARAIACTIVLLFLPSCGIPPRRAPEPGPNLPPNFNGVTSPENSGCLSIDEFYNDSMLLALIEKGLADNRELRNLNEDVRMASNEVLARSGQYLPFVSVTANAGLNRYSHYFLDGDTILNDPYNKGHVPLRFFPNPMGDFLTGLNLTWQLDIYRQLRTARDSAGQRYVAAAERRNYFVTRLVADIAENYFRLMALDKRLENLDQVIELQEQSLKIAQARKEFARGNELAVLRFQAELQRNRSEKLIVNQSIIEGENRINYLVNRYPQRVERVSAGFYDLTIHPLDVGVPSQLVLNRPDIRQAERELVAAGLDVYVARINFFPQLVLNAGVGLQSFSLAHFFMPNAVIGDIAGGLVGPLVNRRAIRAQYLTANARQIQAIYNYQRTILNAFTEVVNRVAMVVNYSKSIEIKKQQLRSLEASVEVASDLFQNARTEYIDVLFAQRDLRDARVALIETKTEQLAAIVNAYQALGGGVLVFTTPQDFRGQYPYIHTVRNGENFWTIALLYYRSARYGKALWAANKNVAPAFDRLDVGTKILIPPVKELDPALIEEPPAPASSPNSEPAPVNTPAVAPTPPPPPPSLPGPFSQEGTKDPATTATAAATVIGTSTATRATSATVAANATGAAADSTPPQAPPSVPDPLSLEETKDPAGTGSTSPPAPPSVPGPLSQEDTKDPAATATRAPKVPVASPKAATTGKK